MASHMSTCLPVNQVQTHQRHHIQHIQHFKPAPKPEPQLLDVALRRRNTETQPATTKLFRPAQTKYVK